MYLLTVSLYVSILSITSIFASNLQEDPGIHNRNSLPFSNKDGVILDFNTSKPNDLINSLEQSPSFTSLELTLSRYAAVSNIERLQEILPHCKGLTRLKITGRLGPEGIEMLASSSNLKNLVELSLTSTDPEEAGVKTLCGKVTFQDSLKKLTLINNRITCSGISSILRSSFFKEVEELYFDDKEYYDNSPSFIQANTFNYRLKEIKTLFINMGIATLQVFPPLTNQALYPSLKKIILQAPVFYHGIKNSLTERFGKENITFIEDNPRSFHLKPEVVKLPFLEINRAIASSHLLPKKTVSQQSSSMGRNK